MNRLLSELKKHPNFFIILAIFVFYLVYDLWWVLNNNLPPTWDDSWHLMSSMQYYRILTNLDSNFVTNLIHVDWYYPPFYKFSTAFVYMLFGVSISSALMTNVIYFGLLLVATYGIGKCLFGKEVGLIATILVSLYPYIINTHHIYLLDLGLTTMVALSLYLLLLTDKFRSLKYSLLFGLVVGLALLTKWTSVFFIAFPTLYMIYKRPEPIIPSFKDKKKKSIIPHKHDEPKPRHWFNFVLGSIVAILVALVWYLPNGEGAYKFIKEMDVYWSGYFGFLPQFSFDALTYYLSAIMVQTTTFFGIVIFFSVGYFVSKRQLHSVQGRFLFLWVVPALVVLTYMLNKSERYSMPILPALAIVTAYAFVSINRKDMKYALFAVGAIQMVWMLTAIAPVEHNSMNIVAMPLPVKENWHHEDVMNVILKDSMGNPAVRAKGFGYVVVLQDHKYINGRTFEYYNMKLNMPYQILNGAYIGEQSFYGNFDKFDYIIDKPGETTTPYKSIVTNISKYFHENKQAYVLIGEYALPNDEVLYVYRNDRR